MGSKLAQNLLKYPGSCLKFKHLLKIANKPPITSWVFITELVNVLKIDKKPPKTSWVFFDIEKCAKNVKKKIPKPPGSSLQNLKMC